VELVTLELRDVVCAYGLRGVSLAFVPGRVAGIVGPNGAGKTTLVRAASRVLRPVAGTVLLDGRDLYGMPAREAARAIAVVPQESVAAFEFTALEVVLLGRIPYARDDLMPVRRAMERTGTWELRDRLFDELSGGERQRVVLARALAQEPRVLLLDEPTAHLDLRYRIAILRLVRSLAREEDLAAGVVLHDPSLAMAYCDEVVVLSEGRVVASGAPREALSPGLLERVYGVALVAVAHPRGGPEILVPVDW
jgi:iron complex transport system ATP-binding protein